MPKIKTNKSAAKRIKKRAGGFKYKKSHLRHILTKKSTKRKRELRQTGAIDKSNLVEVRKMLPNS